MDALNLIAALEELGAERVTRGLGARGHGWDDCFLTVATCSESRALAGAIKRRWYTDAMAFLSAQVGLSPRSINLVVRAWDRHEVAFRTVAIEWLEQRNTLAAAGERHVLTADL
ncbi:MAG TPA: hypothetical protein VEO73_07280 [Gemmatimonadales bacterium]|nr:hypothetical protein [Gemmatimonadales bacterium]